MVEREARMIEMILFLHPRIKVWVVWVDTFRQLLVAFTGTLMEPPPPILQQGKLTWMSQRYRVQKTEMQYVWLIQLQI